MNPKLLDLVERVGWTFVQGLAGAIVSAGTASTLQAFDWRAALAGAGTAAVISLLKIVGVNVSLALHVPASPATAPVATPAPVLEDTLALPVTDSGAGAVSAAAGRHRGPFLGS